MAYLSNRSMALQIRFLSDRLIRLFVGEPEDIPHKRFGFLLPNKRDFAHRYYQFLGYIIRMKKNIPDLHMVCVCGELFGKKLPQLSSGVELHSFIPNIFEYYAACDMAVVVGGGTTTVGLTALRRPFIFFPLEKQFDQQLYIAERLARQRAGIKMQYSQTTPELLAQTIMAHIGEKAGWKPIPTNGAQKAAELINRIFRKIP